MNRSRAYRRHKNKVKIQERITKWKAWDAGEFATKNVGKFRKNNFSCSCYMCKNWKHNRTNKKDSMISKEWHLLQLFKKDRDEYT
jgi:hypothetical protein